MGAVATRDGRRGNAVIVGPRENPKGVLLVFAGAGGALDSVPLANQLDQLAPGHVIDILCMQERLFGDRGLERPPDVT